VVSYDGIKYPGEVRSIDSNTCVQVDVMQNLSGSCWKWPQPRDMIYYNKINILHIAAGHCGVSGQFTFSDFPCDCVLLIMTMLSDGFLPRNRLVTAYRHKLFCKIQDQPRGLKHSAGMLLQEYVTSEIFPLAHLNTELSVTDM
jgi:hypothetical protein